MNKIVDTKAKKVDKQRLPHTHRSIGADWMIILIIRFLLIIKIAKQRQKSKLKNQNKMGSIHTVNTTREN